MWKDLNMAQKSELMKIFIKQGIYNTSEMASIYDKNHSTSYNNFATGGNMSDDYDPKNPYHVHNNGEKIVITPEQYEKHKDEPYFANIRKQVEEHQAAYPKPEYTETLNPEYRKVYANVKAASNQHFKEHYFNGQIYREYSEVPETYFRNSLDGVVTDKEGNLYRPMTVADAGKGVTPMFTTTERDYHNGRNFDMSWVRVKTPPKTIKTLKQPLPVDRIYDVDKAYKKAYRDYMINNSGTRYNVFAQTDWIGHGDLNPETRHTNNAKGYLEYYDLQGIPHMKEFIYDGSKKDDLGKVVKTISSKIPDINRTFKSREEAEKFKQYLEHNSNNAIYPENWSSSQSNLKNPKNLLYPIIYERFYMPSNDEAKKAIMLGIDLYANGGNLFYDGGEKEKVQKAVQDKNTYAKYNIAKQSWDENGALYEMQLPPVSITADSPKTEANKKVLLNHGYTQEDLENPNIKAHLPALANMLRNYDINGINYLKGIGTVGVGLAGILTGGSGIGLAGALGREGIKQGAKTLGRKALRFSVDTGVGTATDYASNKAIQGLSNGEYKGFGDLMNRGVFNGNKDDVWKPVLWDIANPLGVATGIGTDVFLNSSNLRKVSRLNSQKLNISAQDIQKDLDTIEIINNSDLSSFPKYDYNNINDYLQHTFIPRWGDIQEGTEALNRTKVPITLIPKDYYVKIKGSDSNVSGWHDSVTGDIKILNNNTPTIIHELTHANRDRNFLDNEDIFSHLLDVDNFFTQKSLPFSTTSDFDIEEYVATMPEFRRVLFDKTNKTNDISAGKIGLTEQNNIIDNYPNPDLFIDFYNTNNYAQEFMKAYNKLNPTTDGWDKVAEMLKTSMKLLPAVGAGATVIPKEQSK